VLLAGEWIDISIPLHNGMVHWPGDPPFHREEVMQMAGGDVCNVSKITSTVHIGTHMDAPHHFVKDGVGIDAMPIEATVGPARVIHIDDPEKIRVSELEPYKISAGERVLFQTRNSDSLWNTAEFQKKFAYIPADTAQYLASKRVMTVGVDYLSVGGFDADGPQTHQALLGGGVWIIEGLNLAGVKPGDYELICLPLRIVGCDGAPARAILRKRG
jgi:arylformamidase